MAKKNDVPPTLCGLPEEIVTEITSSLDDCDVAALHNVNKKLFHKTKFLYGRRFFENIHVFMTPVSFEKLAAVSQDSTYALAVKHVTISTYVLRDKGERRYGSSTQPWDDEKSFIFFTAADAVTDVFNKCRNLATLVICDYGQGHNWNAVRLGIRQVPAWGFNKLNRLLSFKTGPATFTEEDVGGYSFGWTLRMKAFEDILVGISAAQLSGNVQIGLSFQGKAPRPLTPSSLPLFLPFIAKAVHFTAELDSYSNPSNNGDWIGKVDPKTMCISYNMKFYEAPGEFYTLQLGTYTRLHTIHLTYAKTTSQHLIRFFKANSDTLRNITIQNISIEWPENANYPWVKVFETLAENRELQYLYPSNLVALNGKPISSVVDYWAFQEVPWMTPFMISLAIQLLLERYRGVDPDEIALWVDLDYVQEQMMLRHRITY